MERNIRLLIEYDGTAYCGWQSQQNGQAIQDQISEAAFKVTGQKINLIGAGRTDAGVHALGQVANFRIEHNLDPARFQDAMNNYLPDDIRIRNSCETTPQFDARRSAIFRRYRYLIGDERSAIFRHQRWYCPFQPDFDKLQEAARIVLGDHDFAPFCVVASRKENNGCRIFYSRWFRHGPLLIYEIRGNRFLHGMVRSLVGSMVNLASVNPDNNQLNLTLDHFQNIINADTDERTMFTAPACGLYLVAVGYEEG